MTDDPAFVVVTPSGDVQRFRTTKGQGWNGNPDDLEPVQLVCRHGWGIAFLARGSCREITNYLANGEIDRSRSHYTVNGRRVSGARYRALMRRL